MTKLEKLQNQPETAMSRKINGRVIKVWWVNGRVDVSNAETGERLGSFANPGPHFKEEKLEEVLKND